MAKAKSELKIYFRKVDKEAQEHRTTASYAGNNRTPHVQERTLESLWHDRKPEGWNFLDWHRAWNGGYPSEEHVAMYNELHPDVNEQIDLAPEDEE